jgi:hypothetical protein
MSFASAATRWHLVRPNENAWIFSACCMVEKSCGEWKGGLLINWLCQRMSNQWLKQEGNNCVWWIFSKCIKRLTFCFQTASLVCCQSKC